MIKVLIADDHPIVRQGLKQILLEESDMAVTGEADNSREVLELVNKRDFDIIVLDITMPGRGGIDVLKELKLRRPNLPIFILSMYPEDRYALRALKAGASGYMTKESAPEELVKAIRQIVKGKTYISPALAEQLALSLRTETAKLPHETLSDREYQVMLMIASGKTPSEIAKELFLSIKTISTYRAHILEKMNLKNNAELIRYALENNLIE